MGVGESLPENNRKITWGERQYEIHPRNKKVETKGCASTRLMMGTPLK